MKQVTTFERIMASAPVNAQAARQLATGEHWTPSVKIIDHYGEMPEITPNPSPPPPSFVDYTGQKFGRLTVLGRAPRKNKNASSSWVCRCMCGYFCTRQATGLAKAVAGDLSSFVAMCGMCSYQKSLREGWTPEPRGKLKL